MTRDAIALAALIATLPATSLAQPRPSGDVAPPPTMGPRLNEPLRRDAPPPPPRDEPRYEPQRRDLPPPPEWAREHREQRQDARETRDDFRDLKRAEALQADYERALRARDRGAMSRLEGDALELIRLEWLERRGELRDDRRAPEADRRDARIDARTMERLRRMGEELYSLRDRFRPREVNRKRGIIADFVRMARKELRWDVREQREDRRERYEDRHDRMDDRHDDRYDDRRERYEDRR